MAGVAAAAMPATSARCVNFIEYGSLSPLAPDLATARRPILDVAPEEITEVGEEAGAVPDQAAELHHWPGMAERRVVVHLDGNAGGAQPGRERFRIVRADQRVA